MQYLTSLQTLPVPLILASASKCRAEILTQMKISFVVCASHIKEKSDKKRPSDVVVDLAVQKARAGLISYLQTYGGNLQNMSTIHKKPKSPYCVVLGADTIISYKNKQYGKPTSQQEARDMLNQLSDSVHSVYTGMCLLKYKIPKTTSPDKHLDIVQNIFKTITVVDSTKVYFNKISKTEIDTYIKNRQWQHVAGAYQIQGLGACFINKIIGLHSTVMGLCIPSVYKSINAICR